jgi:hypothetical protein
VPCALANPGSREIPATHTVTNNIRRIILMMSLKHRPAISLPATTKSKKRNNDQKDKKRIKAASEHRPTLIRLLSF